MKQNSARFAKGSGCFKCTVCGRQTRATKNVNAADLKQCPECYEIAGIENQIATDGDPDGKLAAEIRQLENIRDEKMAPRHP